MLPVVGTYGFNTVVLSIVDGFVTPRMKFVR